jgi:Leucine Rich repeat
MSDSDWTDSSDVLDQEDSAAVDDMVERILNNDVTLTKIAYCYDDGSCSEETPRRLVEALQNNVMVDWLLLVGCFDTVNLANALGQLLRTNRRIRHLVLSHYHSVGSEGIIAIMEGLCENRKLKSIDLRSNRLGATALYEISRMMRVNNTLENLNLGWNELPNDERFVDFTLSLASNRSLVRLDLDHCALASSSCQNLFECIQSHPTITHLELTGNRINSDISESLCELLRHNQSLRRLNLGSNHVGSRTAAAAALALEENVTLKTLCMANNGIDDEGACAFSRSLPRITGLHDLSMDANAFTLKGGEAMMAALESNRSLQAIGFERNAFVVTPKMKQKIAFYRRRNMIGWSTLESPSVTLALWPLIFARLSSEPHMIYFFLYQDPSIISPATLGQEDRLAISIIESS